MTKNSTDSTGDLGNTGTKSQPGSAIKWCFTYNNYSNDDYLKLINNLEPIVLAYVIGKEVGENGTPHLQGYCKFKKRFRLTALKKINEKIHWEKCKGSEEQNITYCTKDGDYVVKGLKIREKVEILKDKDLYVWQKKIVELLNKKPDNRTINWYWEPDGCTGKTTFCKYIYMKFENVVMLSGKGADMKNGIVEYDKKNGILPKIVIINIPRSTHEFVSYSGIEEVKDMFFYSGKYEGGMICGNPPHVIVFANEEPDYDKMSNDRWNVVNLNKNVVFKN